MEALPRFGKQIRQFSKSILLSYGQVFFSDNLLFSLVLLLVSFFDPYAGGAGLLSIVTIQMFAVGMGFEREWINKGLLGFNGLLTGLGLGIYFEPGPHLFFIVSLAAVFSFFMSVALQGVIGKYALPFMSMPFLITIWIFTLATRNFDALGISERGIYTMNNLFGLGGNKLVLLYEWWNKLDLYKPLRIYFLSLGAVFFQYNILSGMLIATGILIYSRIAFTLSVVGYSAAYLFYLFTGASITEFSYSYAGFNYILTAIALGGFFIVPGWKSFAWTIVLIPLVAVVTISLGKIFLMYQLPVYSLPFNLVVLLFLYVLKFRYYPSGQLSEVPVQHNSPEKNVYSWLNWKERFRYPYAIEALLPFYGEWVVSQSRDGEHTHQGPWRYAWDFVVAAEDGKQYKNEGNRLEDYFCFNKPVLATAEGVVAEIADGIRDNLPGEINTVENWGNTVIIRHTDTLYSKLSHLKESSIVVKKGDQVKCGQLIGHCGNSGRSPYPHLHFQFQSQPYIGAVTMEYPLSNYISREGKNFELHTVYFPEEGNRICNIDPDPLLTKAFDLVPGKQFTLVAQQDEGKQEEICEVRTNAYNQSYIWCEATKSSAWFTSTSRMIYFTHFSGKKNGLLYYYFLAFYKLQKGFYPTLKIRDQFAINILFHGPLLWLQDFIIPFYQFLYTEFRIEYASTDNRLSPSLITLQSRATQKLFSMRLNETSFRILVGRKGVESFEVFSRRKQMKIVCVASALS